MIEFDDIEAKIESLPTFYLELGVLTDKSERKITAGLNNAQLMFIHENGSPLNHIPRRPVLQMTIDFVKREWLTTILDRAIDRYISSGFDVNEYKKELEQFCVRVQNYARKIIYSNDGRLAPNSPSVAAKKKGNHPLFDTGQLVRSITCRLVESSENLEAEEYNE